MNLLKNIGLQTFAVLKNTSYKDYDAYHLNIFLLCCILRNICRERAGSVPGLGTKILQATQRDQKRKKKKETFPICSKMLFLEIKTARW